MGEWVEKKLSEVCNISIGGTPARANSEYWDTDCQTENYWVSIRDMNQKVIESTSERISKKGVANSNAKLVKKGTVLLSFKLSIGKVAIAGKDLFTNEAIAALEAFGIENEFLFHGLHKWDLLQDVDQAVKGATLNKAKLKKIKFIIPASSAEQTTIATILTTIDQAIKKTEHLIAKYERIKTGLMQDLLTRGIDEQGRIRSEEKHKFKDSQLGRIPVEWEVMPISQIVKQDKDVTYGIVQPGFFDPNGALLIRGVDYISGWKPVESFFKVRLTLHEQYKRSKVTAGDVLICIVGATTGTVQVIPPFITDANITQTTARISCNDEIVDGFFIFYQLQSIIGAHQVRKYIKGSAQPGLNLKDVEKFFVKIPKKDEQEKISNIIQRIDTILEKEKFESSKLCKMKSALMQDLLTANVCVNVLLNQITESL